MANAVAQVRRSAMISSMSKSSMLAPLKFAPRVSDKGRPGGAAYLIRAALSIAVDSCASLSEAARKGSEGVPRRGFASYQWLKVCTGAIYE